MSTIKRKTFIQHMDTFFATFSGDFQFGEEGENGLDNGVQAYGIGLEDGLGTCGDNSKDLAADFNESGTFWEELHVISMHFQHVQTQLQVIQKHVRAVQSQ